MSIPGIEPFAFSPAVPRLSRREDLLNVAARQFAVRGYHGVTMDEIGAASGISGPALYHYFASKEALLGEMLTAISGHLLAQGQSILTHGLGPRPTLDRLILMHATFAVDEPELITVHYRDLPQAAEMDRRQVRRMQTRYVQIWIDTLVRWRPGFDSGLASATVHAVFGLLNSTPYSGRLERQEMISLLTVLATAAVGGVVLPQEEMTVGAR